jgi:general secretion pathway protein E
MGIEPFLLSSSLVAVMAQRLVRLLCKTCKQGSPATACEAESHQLPTDALLYRPVGCDHCNHTGYRGRKGIFELIQIDSELGRLIHENASERELLQHSRAEHAGVLAHGRSRILAGDTSLEEVLRVTAAG